MSVCISEIKDAGDTLDEAEIISGGMDVPLSWDEYLDEYADEMKPHIGLIRQAIEGMNWVGKTGSDVCNDTIFSFSDGERIAFTWRAWGDLMHAIVGKKEGYIKYYC